MASAPHVLDRPVRRTQSDRREAAERALIEAALSLIAVHGVKGMTLGDVGETAGYSRGIAAHYFKSKDGLLQAAAEDIYEHYSRLLGGDSTRPGLETIFQFVDLSCTTRRLPSSRAMYLMQKDAFFNTAGLAGILKKYNRQALNRLEREIRVGIANGEIRKDADPKSEAMILLAMTRGIRSQWILAPNKVNLLKMKGDVIAFIRRSLAAGV